MRSGGSVRTVEEGSDLLDMLRDAGYLSAVNVALIRRFVDRWGTTPLDAILDSDVLAEERLADAIAEAMKIERIYAFDRDDVDTATLLMLPFKAAHDLEMVILGRSDESGALRVMMVDPSSGSRWRVFRANIREPVKVCVAERRLVRRSIQELYPVDAQLPGLFG